MLVVALLVVAAIAFGVGWATEEELWVQVALGASVLAALVVLWRILVASRTVANDARTVTHDARVVTSDDSAEVPEPGPNGGSAGTDEPDEGSTAEAAAETEVDAHEGDAASAMPVVDSAASDSSSAASDSSSAASDSSAEVVFLPRRTTFHAAECAAVAERPVARGTRAELEAAGMTPCRRCLAPAGS